MTKEEILEREKRKYNHIHQRLNYGGKTGRIKQFAMAKDKLHIATRKAIKKSLNLLDVGCGKGAFMDWLRNNRPEIQVMGIDIAEEVKKHRSDLNIIIASASDIPFGDSSFDFVCFQDGLEHIPIELEQDVLNEMYRVCKKYMYLTIAIHEVPHNDKIYSDMGLGAIHINMKTIKEWKNVFIKFVIENKIKYWLFDADKYWVFIYMEK